MKTKSLFLLALVVFALTSLVSAQDRAKTVGRLQAAGTVLEEIMAAPDKGVPEEILSSAKCVAVVPTLLKGGFIVGGTLGKGVATCRTSSGWSAPVFFRLEGGSFGLQIGGQAVDLVMMIMNDRGMNGLLSSKFKLGADASVAAGPVGRHAEGMTDWKMRAEVLTYSRARGVFAGVTLNGAAIRQDKGSTEAFYGRMVPYKSIFAGETPVPAEAQPFVGSVSKYATQSKAEKQPEKPAPAPAAEKQPEKPAEPAPAPTTEQPKN
jgi:lipid-binding SYLF domain-containing protein